MKKIILLLTVIFTCSMSYAKIWRVNNNTGITADFTTAQAAHDAAAAGDTIHLEPSITTYGGVTTTKKLVWLSIGDFLTPGLQYSSTPGKLDGLSVNIGSENSVFSCRFTLSSCDASNVTYSRCYSENYIIFTSTSSNSIIINCYITSSININGTNTNIIISNNIVGDYISVDQSSSAIITNNVINARSGSQSNIFNSQIQNNIFSQTSGTYTFTNSNINNNIANLPSFLPAGNGNINSVDMNSVFVNYQGLDDASFLLKAGSPAIGTGFGGGNMGAFAGSSPYVLALQPGIPAIYQINAPAAPSGTTMNVTFSTKSNN